MTPNKKVVETYMDGFRKTDRAQILSCLTDDIEWFVPGLFHVHGKEAFATHIVDDGFTDKPPVKTSRMLEEGDTVVAEGSVLAARQDGSAINMVFCDVFDLKDGKIRKLVSYLVEAK
jgi:uncharacterized protein